MGRFLVLALCVASCADPAQPGTCALVEPGVTAPASGGAATTIYLNRDGGKIQAGTENAAANTSSIIKNHEVSELVVPRAAFDDTQWSAVVDCVRDAYARFDVEIVDRRPAAGSYVMAMFGGSGDALGLGAETRGIAPLDSNSCTTIDNAVAFVFTETVNSDVQRSCEIAAHEIAHAFGVDHQLLAADLTSYLPFSGKRTFQDVDGACGEDAERPCICGRETQNTVQVLLDKLGPARGGDREAPVIELGLGAARPGMTAVRVQTSDASAIGSVSLTYRDERTAFTVVCGDGTVECRTFSGITTFTIAEPVGHAVMYAEAVDLAGNAAATVPFEIGSLVSTAVVAVSRDARFAHVEVTAVATEVIGFWTAPDGTTMRRALCGDAERWTLDVELDDASERRSIVIQTVESSGRMSLTHANL
ncbi:MAG: hypothetical protein H0V17_24935 [Deltaproteobacteria bacterium]|nr:hypothetical protein [Deltaproteobacteria bacterium]